MLKVLVGGLALLALACGADQPAPARDTPPGGKPRLLVVTYAAGFRHASIPVAEQTLADLATRSGAFEASFARSAEDVKAMTTKDALAGFAGAFFVSTTGDLGIDDLAGFLTWIAEGHAFLGAHAAADTYHDRPEYLAMLGAEFDRHGAPCTVRLAIEDAAHPAASPLAPSFEITDEIYEWKASPRPNAHVLLSLDRHPPDGHPEAGQPMDLPLAWTRAHGKGRVFYTALGHGEDVWKDRRFQDHLLGAIRWSLASS